MPAGELAGKVQTVLGVVDPGGLGITSSHEHILSDMSAYLLEPEDPAAKQRVHEPLSLCNLAWARAHRFSNLDNMRLNDQQEAAREVRRFKDAGGGTIVEMSPRGMCRDPKGLAEVARAAGVNIVMGCGYYLGISHPGSMDQMSAEQIADEIVGEILEGADSTGVKPGIIGEIGCSKPLDGNELKVLRGAAAAQRRTGAPMDVHPSFDDALALQIVDVLREAGASLEHVMISHMEVFDFTLDTRLKLLGAGCYIGYDNFGNLGYPHLYLGRVVNLTSDVSRIRDIKELIDLGFADRILLGQDTVFKDSLSAYGGYGYAHLLENVVPLMRDMGIEERHISSMLVDNPRRFLAFAEPTG
jgi:phosphotriesterase-related protein